MVEAVNKTAENENTKREPRKSLQEQIVETVPILLDFMSLLFYLFYYVAESLYRLIYPVALKPVKGEIVLITGTGHGIGKQLALTYAAEGATVVGWDVNVENNKNTMNEIERLGYPKAYAYVCDVSKRENVQEVAKKVKEEVGDVTILVNNAGIMPTHSLSDHTEEEIRRILDINLLAHFWTIQAFLPSMKKNNHGHIVSLSSLAGLVGLANLVPYCASKFAVRGLTESLSEELRLANPKNRIRITTICPYMVDTGLCKKPKIRFTSFMELLSPAFVAKKIVEAQRSDAVEVTIPAYLHTLNKITRVLPNKFSLKLIDFFESGVESDLP